MLLLLTLRMLLLLALLTLPMLLLPRMLLLKWLLLLLLALWMLQLLLPRMLLLMRLLSTITKTCALRGDVILKTSQWLGALICAGASLGHLHAPRECVHVLVLLVGFRV